MMRLLKSAMVLAPLTAALTACVQPIAHNKPPESEKLQTGSTEAIQKPLVPPLKDVGQKKKEEGKQPPPQQVPAPATSTCNGELALENLLIEGQPEDDPNRATISLLLSFQPGPDWVVDGVKRTSVVIKERMDISFFRDWLAQGVSGLAAQINGSMPDSCTISRGPTSGSVSGRVPASFSLKQSLTKRHCSSFDQPCGLPETTCTGGDAGALPSCSLPSCSWSGCSGGGCSGGRPPTLPTCTTTVKMCRVEQKVDLFSAEVQMDYTFNLAVAGQPPNQTIVILDKNTRNDVSTSQGDLGRFLSDAGIGGVFGYKVSEFESGMKDMLNRADILGGATSQLFPVPTSQFVYMPTIRRNEDVAWITPATGTAVGIRVFRDMALPTSLACRVKKCFEQSKAAGKLLTKSCSIS